MISGLTFGSLSHFGFIFTYSVRKLSNFIHSHPIFPAPLMEETVFSPLYILASFAID